MASNNDKNSAARYAWQNNVAKQGESGKADTPIYQDIYFIHHPQANNPIAELVVAGYEKMIGGELSKNLHLDNDNSTSQVIDVMKQYGKNGLFVGSHSRGTLTVTNALGSLNTEENQKGKILSDTTIKMVGPAAHVIDADKNLSLLQTGEARSHKEGSIRIENHKLYPVGSWSLILGGNPYTMDDYNKKNSVFKRFTDLGTLISSHNCYGLGQQQCRDNGYRQENDTAISKERYIYDLYPNMNKKDK